MPIIATANSGGSSTFTPHPTGQFTSVCVDVDDLGLVEVTWQGQTKKQHKIDIYFFCDEWKELDGGDKVPLLVRSRFTLTLSEKGNLRPFLESWREKDFTEQELAGFDVEKLIGAPAFISVTHREANGNTYANIKTIMRLPKGMEAPALPADFKRRHVREAEKAAENGQDPEQTVRQMGRPPQHEEPWPGNDPDELPFS